MIHLTKMTLKCGKELFRNTITLRLFWVIEKVSKSIYTSLIFKIVSINSIFSIINPLFVLFSDAKTDLSS